MSYTKNVWTDRNVQYPTKYTIDRDAGAGNVIDGEVVAMTASPGTITAAGTAIIASKLNNLEEGSESANNPKYSNGNLLSNTVAGCESTSGWVEIGTSPIALDSSNKVEGANSLNISATVANTGRKYTGISVSANKYYLISFYHFETTGILSLNCYDNTNGATLVSGAVSEETSFTRAGFIFSTTLDASDVFLQFRQSGATAVDFNIDAIMLTEISASDYALGVTALLTKYPYSRQSGIVDNGEIISLPSSNVESGEFKSVVSGRTDVNVLDDSVAGCESTSGWSTGGASLAIDSSNEVEGTNCLKITLGASSGGIYRDEFTKIDTSKYYLLSSYLKNFDCATGIKMYLGLTGGAGNLYSNNISATTWSRVGYIVQPSDFTSVTNFYIGSTLVGASSEYAFQDAIQINEISQAEYNLGADALLDNYPFHLGMKGAEPSRIKSVGVNLFDKDNDNENDGYSLASTGAIQVSSSAFTSKFYKVGDSTAVTLSDINGTTLRLSEYTLNTNTGSHILRSTGTTEVNVTLNASTKFIRFSGVSASIDTVQLEFASSATTYTPYTSTKAYTHATLNSVPAIADWEDLNEGVRVQNVEADYVLLSGDIDSVANGTNLQRAVIGLNAFSGIKTQTASTIDLETIVTGLVSETDGYDTIGDDNKWYTDATNLYALAALGTWADVAAARTALTSTVTTLINYQLATPVTTYYPPQTLISHPAGTVYNESVFNEQFVYNSDNNGITLTDVNFPISALDVVTKFNKTTGEMTPIAISDCTVASGGLTFTISGGVTGEFYDVEFYYQFLSTRGEQAYIYPTNVKGQTDDNSKMIKQVDEKVNILKKEVDSYHIGKDEWELIEQTTTTVDAAQIDIEDISSIYKEFELVLQNGQSDTVTSYDLKIGFNDDSTTTNYKSGVNDILPTLNDFLYSSTGVYKSYAITRISDLDTEYSTVISHDLHGSVSYMTYGVWEITDKITKINLIAESDNIEAGMKITLYGRR